jgi:hypothetical protein
VSSCVPWCTSSGSVIRSKYGRADATRQNSGDLSGRPYVRAIRRLVLDRSSDRLLNCFQLSAASELTEA